MKNFRKAAVALAAASTVAFAGTSVASAEDKPAEPGTEQSLVGSLDTTPEGAKPGDDTYFGGIFAKIGKELEANQGITGHALFGSAQTEDQPIWSQIFKFGSIALLVAGLVAAVSAVLPR